MMDRNVTDAEYQIMKSNALEKRLLEYLDSLYEYERTKEDMYKYTAYGMRRVLVPAIGRSRIEHAERAFKEIMPYNPSKFFTLYNEYLEYCYTEMKVFRLVWETEWLEHALNRGHDMPEYLKQLFIHWIRVLKATNEIIKERDGS